MFSPPIRKILCKCAEQIYANHNISALNLIRITLVIRLIVGKCLKVVNARYSLLVKMQCMELLATFLDCGKTEMSIFVGDCLSVVSKLNRTTIVFSFIQA